MCGIDHNLDLEKNSLRGRKTWEASLVTSTTGGLQSCTYFEDVFHAKEFLLHSEGMCDRSVYFGPERAGSHRCLPLKLCSSR